MRHHISKHVPKEIKDIQDKWNKAILEKDHFTIQKLEKHIQLLRGCEYQSLMPHKKAEIVKFDCNQDSQ